MSRTLAILSLSTCLAVAPSGLFARSIDIIRPVVMVATDLSPIQGETVTYTVALSGIALQSGSLTISSSTQASFFSLPTTATYNAGDLVVVFSGTLSSSASGDVQVSASNASGAASLMLTVAVTADSVLKSVRF